MAEPRQGITVVVPTLNRGSYVLDTLSDLIAQDYRPLEILVVDQSPEKAPGLMEFAAAHPHVITYRHVSFRGLPLARNYGWQQARYEAILFVDDDIRCGPSLAREHMRVLSQAGVGMVAGGIDERVPLRTRPGRPGRFSFWTATPGRGFEATGECPAMHVPGGNFSVWREVLQQAGGFDEALSSGAALYEETEFCLRARRCGYEIRFSGDARLTHLAAGSGGCRVPAIQPYIHSLAHNRAFLIRRHLRWFHVPTAFARLLLLAASYAWHYRDPRVLRDALKGFGEGWHRSRLLPVCSQGGPAPHVEALQA